MKKRKIEVHIKDKDGRTTFYGSQVVTGDKITVPLGDIIKAQRTETKPDKQPTH